MMFFCSCSVCGEHDTVIAEPAAGEFYSMDLTRGSAICISQVNFFIIGFSSPELSVWQNKTNQAWPVNLLSSMATTDNFALDCLTWLVLMVLFCQPRVWNMKKFVNVSLQIVLVLPSHEILTLPNNVMTSPTWRRRICNATKQQQTNVSKSWWKTEIENIWKDLIDGDSKRWHIWSWQTWNNAHNRLSPSM